jgi:hypothetical protein
MSTESDRSRMHAEINRRLSSGESPIYLMHEFGINAVDAATSPRKGERRSLLRRKRRVKRMVDDD